MRGREEELHPNRILVCRVSPLPLLCCVWRRNERAPARLLIADWCNCAEIPPGRRRDSPADDRIATQRAALTREVASGRCLVSLSKRLFVRMCSPKTCREVTASCYVTLDLWGWMSVCGGFILDSIRMLMMWIFRLDPGVVVGQTDM